MGRKPAPLTPRKVVVNGNQDRWEVRIPAELRKQEGATRRFFAREAEAKGFVTRLKISLVNYSNKARGLSDAQKIIATECFARLAEVPGASMEEAVTEYLARKAQSAKSVTVEYAGAQFLSVKLAMGGRGSKARTIQEARTRWAIFARTFAGRLVSEISSQEIHDWLLGLMNQSGQPLALQTRRNIRRVVHSVFAFAKDRVRGWTPENPVSHVKLPQGQKHRVVTMPIADVERALRLAHPQLVPYVALCAFAGLRPDHAKRMTWEQIHFDRGTGGEIEVYAGSDKTDRARIIPMQPNLAAWLLLTPENERRGKVYHTRERFVALRTALGWESWPQDALRHDYATYRLKITGSFGTVADEMGNSESVIRSRYMGSVSRSEAEAYWNIFPG